MWLVKLMRLEKIICDNVMILALMPPEIYELRQIKINLMQKIFRLNEKGSLKNIRNDEKTPLQLIYKYKYGDVV